jgi:hypothetical protein
MTTTEIIDVATAARFWSRVDQRSSDECWPWLAGKAKGYGTFSIGGRSHPAHTISYQQIIGPVPIGLQLDHLCRNRGCVNPQHLEPVTRKENILRGVSFSAVNGAKTHCPNGHPYDSAHTRVDPRLGYRRCRECQAAGKRRRRAAGGKW